MMTAPRRPTPPQTNHKAWAAAAATGFSFLAAVFGYGEPPPLDEVHEAVTLVLSTLAASAAGFIVTWLKQNYLKQ